MKDLNETLLIDIRKGNDCILVGVKHNDKAKVYKYEVYWFNTQEDFDSDFDVEDQEFNSRFCEDKKEAYAYGFEAIKNSQVEHPEIKVKIFDLKDE